jgi:ribosomal protein S18 acetylase RimI-like enzyme
MNMEIKEFDRGQHQQQVIDLWNLVFHYQAPHNDPELVIKKKVDFNDGLFFVALKDQAVIGTIMAGYDGRRGWIYAMAVAPEYQERGVGSELLSHAEEKLRQRGCLKVNLQIMNDNQGVQDFYRSQGYSVEKRISMGKPLYREFKPPETKKKGIGS